MSEKGLASRFKAAISKEAEKGQQADMAKAQQEARRARFIGEETRLFDTLTGLVAEIGGIEVTRADEEMVMTRGDRRMSLHRGRAGERLDIRFDGESVGASLELMDEAWYLETARRRVALFDAGLEELLVQGLGLPTPDGSALQEIGMDDADEPAVVPEAEAPAPEVEAVAELPFEPGEQVILRDVKLDKSGAAPGAAKGGPKDQVILRDVQVDRPSGDSKTKDRDLGSPGSQIRDLPKW